MTAMDTKDKVSFALNTILVMLAAVLLFALGAWFAVRGG